MLRLGKIEDRFASIILLSNIKNESSVKDALAPYKYATYQNRVEEISNIFKVYRQKASVLVAMAYILIFVILVFKYRFKQAIKVIAPPLVTAIIILGFLGFLSIEINIFTFLALLLILAIGIDYTIFFAESTHKHEATGFAILLSSITTILSLGLLAISSTPALSTIGSTMFAGIILAGILSPMAKRNEKGDNQ